MKLKHLLILFVMVCGPWCAPLSALADTYPTTSYTLSDDGSTLVKWTGEESVIDMTSDPAFNQVTTIGEEAFAFNGTFTSITLPSNVTTIGQGAFNLATALETVLLPDGLLTIGEKAFRKCYAIKSISLPAQLKTIGSLAFENCEHLESVTLPASVTSLGARTFCDCTALKDITLSPSLTDWGEYSFTYCTVLEEVNIPEGITSVPAGTFYQCYEIKKISLPSSLQEIGEKAFTDDYHNMDKIAEVTCRAIAPPIADNVWSAQQDDATLYVARRALSAYRNHAQWSQFGTILAFDGDDYPNEDFATDTEAIVDELLKNNYNDYVIKGIYLLDKKMTDRSEIQGIPLIDTSVPLFEAIGHEWVDEAFFFLSSDYLLPKCYIDTLLKMGITIHFSYTSFYEEGIMQRTDKIGSYYVVTNSLKIVTAASMAAKRVFDIIGGLVGCLLTGVIFIFIAPIIYIQSPGPIFFSQWRVGKNGRKFKIYKFRSMYMDAEERKKEYMAQNKMSGLMFKMDDDPRIIGSERKDKNGKPRGIGNFIRKTSLDEFPQFWNVLIGDMSLVGTRPPTV
ncbi:MAG: leucine-rich repeat protein, partial [Prevotella sp.]|nr:leucine-rich repeat protein [Prevotella sp.]